MDRSHTAASRRVSPSSRRQPAEPFFEPRGSVGVLLIHGFSGSPAELQPMGAALAADGYTVYGPVLAGHTGTPEAMRGVPWSAWAASAEMGLQRLRETCETVFVAGISLGALLALYLAARTPVAGVIAMAPALRLQRQALLRLVGLAKYVMPWYYPFQKTDFSDPAVQAGVRQWMPDADLSDSEVIARIRSEARLSVSSLHELTRLQRQVRRELPRVSVPALLMQGRRDQTVDLRGFAELTARLGSREQQVLWFERSGHMLPLDVEREAVWAAALNWLRSISLAKR